MKDNLSRIRSRWRRLLITIVVNGLLFISRLRSSRARIHWVGNTTRPLRLERALIAFLFIAPYILLGLQQQLLWAVGWGSAASLFLITHTAVKLIPRRRYHYIRK